MVDSRILSATALIITFWGGLFFSSHPSGIIGRPARSISFFTVVDTIPSRSKSFDQIYQAEQVDKLARFNGGTGKWNKFLERNINMNDVVDTGSEHTGNIIIEFVVTKNGKLKDVRSLTADPDELDNRYMQAIKKSPDWIPASIKGKPVDSYVRLVFPYPHITRE
ncbi:energy transducer TonB [Terrimonas sp. NA20]|uniref:Energy transducer TonB n=1 Tax=Terrimonas ginsenosidimutans TaxID=2908004 RepID=A0ABS9KZX6_9BACT|nr:energy transducer TonB [Terrimonas ginsenosidimutans]MCG2617799.1 energy transducer TonB [Terrimonas ginsenosidimutans]